MKGISSFALYQYLLEDLLPFSALAGAPEIGIKGFAADLMARNFYKKFAQNVSDKADANALDKFLSVNKAAGVWNLQVASLEDELLVNHFRDELYSFFYPGGMPLIENIGQILDRGTLGPGMSLGADSNDFYTKLFASRLTTTSMGLYRGYTEYIRDKPDWQEAENHRLELFGDPEVVGGNRLTFVPKKDDISRSICIEPVLNMFYQQGIKQILEERLVEYFGIDLANQQGKNRELARIGSERWNSEQGLATLDLSSASDSISLRMLDMFLPRQQLAWMKMCRSPETTYTLNGKKEVCKLEMISTMGNAFTFPLQTILFSCVVSSCFQVGGLVQYKPRGRSLGNFGVNGDDIVLPVQLYGKAVRLLELLGFEVNTDKSFHEGPFRESCGADYYKGSWVRPVYVKRLDSAQDLYSLINQLNLWSVRTEIPLRRTVGYLLSRVPLFEVPMWENADCGVWTPRPGFYRKAYRNRNGSILYSRWVPRQVAYKVDEERELIYSPKGGYKDIRFNRTGLYLAFLRGDIRSGRILVRPTRVRYRTKESIAPNWERTDAVTGPLVQYGGPALEKLVHCTF